MSNLNNLLTELEQKSHDLREFWIQMGTPDIIGETESEMKWLWNHEHRSEIPIYHVTEVVHPTHQELLAVVRMLAEACQLRKYHDDDCADSTEKFKPHEMCECGASVVKQALTAAEAMLRGKG